MVKYIDKITKHSQWIILGAMLLGYWSYLVLKPDASIEQTLQDWQTWVHTLFVVSLNVGMVSVALDTATDDGTSTKEFDLANKTNDLIIKEYNNFKEPFRVYVKDLNAHELKSMQEEYLFSLGDKELKELTKKERKTYDNLKPIHHNIFGFNLPLYYEITKNGQVNYKASIQKNEGKKRKQLAKAFMGLIFSAMTINMAFAYDNVGSAFISLFIIATGLAVTFFMLYVPHLNRFRKELPNKVMAKKTLLDSFKESRKAVKDEVIENAKDNNGNVVATIPNGAFSHIETEPHF